MFIFFSPPFYVALCASKARHRFGSERVSWCLETSLFLRLPSRDRTPSLPLLSLFLSFIFFPTSFQRVGVLFWVTDVLCRHSEVVLWNLLSVQMFFWWICGGESGLPVLFLSHLRTLSCSSILITPTINKKKIGGSFILSPNKCKFIYELFSMFLLLVNVSN